MPKLLEVRAASPLLAWLLIALQPLPRTRVKQLLKHGRVKVNGTITTQFDRLLQPGDWVAITADAGAFPPSVAGIPIVFQDEDLLVIDKPAGLLSVATEGEKLDTAFAHLHEDLRTRRQGRPFVVHRLDRNTSGLLLFARSADMRDRLQADWLNVTKTYLALVEGIPQPAEGTIENHLMEGRDLRVRLAAPGRNAKHALTRFRTIDTCGGLALLEVELVTGRKHQIRVHLASLGNPVIGDELYGAASDQAGRLGLHSWRLAFAHPRTGRPLELEAPLPTVLQRTSWMTNKRTGTISDWSQKLRSLTVRCVLTLGIS